MSVWKQSLVEKKGRGTNRENWNEAAQHQSDEAWQMCQMAASVEIKHNQQNLTEARQAERLNRRREEYHWTPTELK